MPTRPRHYAVFILNPDGSGTVKQFDTWQEAMEAYADSSNAGKAVYLYPQPLKAIGITPTGPGAPTFVAPAAAPVQFTAEQNFGQQTVYEDPDPWLRRPPTRNGFTAVRYDYWIEYCKQNPNHRSCSWPGYPKFGTIVREECDGDPEVSWKSTNGQMFPGRRAKLYMADGMGGSVFKEYGPSGTSSNKYPSPCGYPDGFREYREFRVKRFAEIAIYGLVGGGMVQAVLNKNVMLADERKLYRFEGGVPVLVREEEGVLPLNEFGFANMLALDDETKPLVPYNSGQPVFDFNFDNVVEIPVSFPLKPTNPEDIEKVGDENGDARITISETSNEVVAGTKTAEVFKAKFPMRNPVDSYNISYDSEAGVGSGKWTVRVSGLTEMLSFEFTPDMPGVQPPQGWAGIVLRGESPPGVTGEFEGLNTSGVDTQPYTWLGPWSYTWLPAGTVLDEDEENYYKANGSGSYYAEAKEEPPAVSYDYEYNDITIEESGQQVRTGSRRREILDGGLYGEWEPWEYDAIGTAYEDAIMSNANWRYTSACGEFVYKNAHKPVTANGTGGYTLGEEVYDGPSAGTVLQTCEQENLRYISDGAGYYTTEDITPPCEDANLHVDGQEGWSYDGCNWSYDPNWNCEDPNLHSGEAGWSYDGCTWSYSEPPPPPDCEDSNLHAGEAGWSYDGCYWTYTPNCPQSGDMVSSTNDPVTFSAGCGTWTIGTAWTTTFTDGNCGTYTDSGTSYNVGNIGECNGNNYFVDAEGNVTSTGACDPSGTILDYGTPSDLTYETPCGFVTYGYSSQYTYADGNCGSYQSTGNTYNVGDFTTCQGTIYTVDSSGSVTTRPEPTCPPNGEWIYGDDCNNYYHDGLCGSYSVDNGNCGGGGGGGCDPSGNQITTGSEPINTNTPCGDVQVGTTDYTDYTDGNCGSYRTYGDPVYYTQGTQVASCGDCNYYSNGDGTVYEDCTPPPPPCEPSDLHVEGEDGWTYDGCHWNQVIEESCYEPGIGPDAESDSSEPTVESMNYLYNDDGSIYATWNGESWVGGDVGSEA